MAQPAPDPAPGGEADRPNGDGVECAVAGGGHTATVAVGSFALGHNSDDGGGDVGGTTV